MQLDLGATAKALAADMAAEAAAAAAGCGVLVGLCGDIAVAGSPPDGGWQIRVTDDHRRGDGPGQTVAIRDGRPGNLERHRAPLGRRAPTLSIT